MKTFCVTIGMSIRCENQEKADEAAEKIVEMLMDYVEMPFVDCVEPDGEADRHDD